MRRQHHLRNGARDVGGILFRSDLQRAFHRVHIVRSAAQHDATGLLGSDLDARKAQRHLQRARVRLVGVRVENLRSRAGTTRQLVLGERDRGWAEADRAVDRAATRFGSAAVRPASLLAGSRP